METAQSPERREWERTLIEMPVTLLVESDRRNVCHDAVTVDLSPRGARVRGKIAVTAGTSIDLISRGDTPRVVPSRVVWVNLTGPDRFGEAGLQFLEPAQLSHPLPVAGR
jgi:hypothetical protein